MSKTEPILQVALDFANLSQALRVAKEAAAGGAQWLEATANLRVLLAAKRSQHKGRIISLEE